MTFALRKARAAFPAALVAIAMGGAALTATPAQAADVPGPKVDLPPAQTVSDAEMQKRVKAVLENPVTADVQRPEGVQAQEPGTASKPPTKTPGKADPKIIGGVEVPAASAKWMVQVYTPDGSFCSGSLIAPAKVLTAAHCAWGQDWVNDGFVVAGATERMTFDSAGKPDFHGGKFAATKRAWVNPVYTDATLKGDVAVLTLDRPLNGLPTLKYAAPTEKTGYAPGTQATVYGWGRTSGVPNSPVSPKLKSATIPVQADSVCPGWDEAKSDFVPGLMFCGGEPASGTDAGTVSPCNGDSGGPLVVGGRIIGVVSWGIEDCIGAGARSVYAKVGTMSAQISHAVDDANLTDGRGGAQGDDKADLLARNKTNKYLFMYASRGRSFAPGVNMELWDAVTMVRQADMDRDSNQDIIYRTYDGKLYWLHQVYNEATNEFAWTETLIGSGWGSFKNVYIPGDITGDTYPDIIGTDASGAMWMWKGRASGTIQAPVKIGSGWTGTAAFAKGDFNMDGKPDLLARDTAKNLLMYPGTGSATAPFGAKQIVGRGWSFNGYAAIGDVTGDTHPDFMARDAAGKLWVYPGTGRPTKVFDAATRYAIATGWNSFDLLG